MHHFRFSQRTLAVVIGLAAVAYTIGAFGIPEFTAVQTPVQPSTLPRGLGLFLIALSVALFFQKSGPKESVEETADEPGAREPGAQDKDAQVKDAQDKGTQDKGAQASGQGEAPRPRFGRLSDPRLEPAVLLLAICLYVALFVPLGFVLSTSLFVVGTAWYLGFAKHWVSATVGVGVSLTLYLAMSEGLEVALPTGPLPF
ncbi:tripartite tricarboxylate transporter TctB family protein [Streptomyces sp. TRM68416]|uniref:tripartite tricarboxylate transporter TctB family protein n=1 Tax=Streptomyces sp. TRM68416 TaxID=2758412 RepID=UPI001661FE70|nr:tripartite tricarboxylate transporter TctB family protein [Streptomyces sp. TRM68416]MBD0838328.1 tripartite tricarboxylate transporter TctB family protein [Streptomyces sp. TRM68416]